MISGLRIVVSIDRQELSLIEGESTLRRYAISSARRGIGFKQGSYRTPTGRFTVREMIGEGHPAGTVFVGRRPVGLCSPGQVSGRDLVLTRILRLDGLDPDNANSWDRYIYIHGTNQESLLGKPASMGCIRMANRDILELFSLIAAGTAVEIKPPTRGKTKLTKPGRVPDPGKPAKISSTFSVTNHLDPTYATHVMASKAASKRGKRYTAEEKKQILDFVADVNSKKKRGGQKAAAEKFGISPLTIANWLKASKKKGPAKKAAAKKVAKKKAGKRGRPAKKGAKKAAKKGAKKRGRPAKKKTAKRGRPAKKGAKRGRPPGGGGGFSAKLRQLATLNDDIAKAEAGLAKMKADFGKLKASL